MDVIVVSTNNQQQEHYWQKRLNELRGIICKADALVIAIHEDWPGGAGNALGTLYAYYKAQEKAKFMYNKDIYAMQQQGASVAIYHTAGQGKRLFPLTASEYNNKSAIALPYFIENTPLALLEAVIFQTIQTSKKNARGRLSVFWGDQIFIPARDLSDSGQAHIEVIGQKVDIPSKAEWDLLDFSSYGLLAAGTSGKFQLLEKVSYKAFLDLIAKKIISGDKEVRKSLGCFSLSPQMTFALLREFSHELEIKQHKLDTDPHFWMPLTLDRQTYQDLMLSKGNVAEELDRHYHRMEVFKEKFFSLHSDADFFDVVDIGATGCWWDYGSIKTYYRNLLKFIANDSEGQAMRLFYRSNLEQLEPNSNCVIKDDGSCLINCHIQSGRVINSVLIGVRAKTIDVKDSVIVNSQFSSLKAEQSLLYNVKESQDLHCSSGTIRADLILPGTSKHLKLYSHQGRDGKADWQTTLPQNSLSFKEVYDKINAHL